MFVLLPQIQNCMFRKYLIAVLLVFTVLASYSQQKIGVVLSGGGALGFAHIGALQAIEEAGYEPQIVSGTSMGALIGVLYAAGYSPAEIMQFAEEEKFYSRRHILKRGNRQHPGLYCLKAVYSVLLQKIPHNSFDSLEKPYCACVMNMTEAKPEYICSGGQLDEYVLASASIPTVFDAQQINGVQYTDGGMLNNFPAQPIREKCDFLIGVDVLPLTHKQAVKSYESLLFALRDVQHVNSLPGRKLCDVLIEVHAIDTYGEFDFKRFRELYEIGYTAAKAQLQAIQK